MKKDVILVPKDKCPLDLLAEMGERTKNCWIFLHNNVTHYLKESKYVIQNCDFTLSTLVLESTEDFPKTEIIYRSYSKDWNSVTAIKADDIAFQEPAPDPEEILFLKMEE